MNISTNFYETRLFLLLPSYWWLGYVVNFGVLSLHFYFTSCIQLRIAFICSVCVPYFVYLLMVYNFMMYIKRWYFSVVVSEEAVAYVEPPIEWAKTFLPL